MQEYIFTKYDKRVPRLFSWEKAKIKKIIPFVISVEHFGSTAVPNLSGKGVIDIYILVPKSKIFLAKEELIKSAYRFYNVKEIDGGIKMIFRKKYKYAGNIRKVHIHLGTIGVKDFEAVLKFRDILRKNRSLCREYEKVKKIAITKTKNSGEDSIENSRIYVKAKDDFIKRVIG